MKWYHYLAAFFSGVSLTHAVPHFIHGISGDFFPTPFANPPFLGPSHPLVNVLCADVLILIGYILLRISKTSPENKFSIIILFLGIVITSIRLSIAFMDRLV